MGASDGKAGSTVSEWLDPDHRPPEVVDRTDELARYREAVGALAAGDGRHLFVYGDPGVGKSLLTATVLESVATPDRTVASVSCGDFESSYTLAIGLVNALRDEDSLSRTGYAEASVLAALADEIAAKPTLLVLDDVDALCPTDLLEELVDVAEAHDLATVCLANDIAVRNDLPFATRRRLCERELALPRYDRGTVRRILADRVSMAVPDDAVAGDAVDRCADLVVETYDGNVRRGIELLGLAVDRAPGDDGTVTPATVERARTALWTRQVRETIAGNSPHCTLALVAVAAANGTTTDAPRIEDVYELYERACDAADVDPITLRGLHDHLRTLRDGEVVTVSSHRTGQPGHYYRYHLAVDPTAVRRALTDAPVGCDGVETLLSDSEH